MNIFFTTAFLQLPLAHSVALQDTANDKMLTKQVSRATVQLNGWTSSHSGNVNIWLSCHWMEGIFRLTFCHPSTAKITWLLVSCRFKANFWGTIREARNRVIQKNPSFTVPPSKVVLLMHHLGSSYCHVLIVPREYSETWIKDEGITVKNMKQ